MGRVHGLFHISRLKRSEHRFGPPRPDSRQTVGLQFDPHRNGICLCRTRAAARGMCLSKDADLVLDMMGNLMGHDIGCRKIPTCPKILCHGREERGVQIDFLVRRAVERAGCPACPTAGRSGDIAIKHQNRGAIPISDLIEKNRGPNLFRIGQHDRDEISGLLIGR